MVSSVVLAVAFGSISLVQNSSGDFCESSLEVTVSGLNSIESPLNNQTVTKLPVFGKVDLGTPKVGHFTFIGSNGNGKYEALSVLLLPGKNLGCFIVQSSAAAVVQSPDAEGLLTKFGKGLGKLDSAAVQAKWKNKLVGVALGSTPVVMYCSLAASGIGAVFAVSCIASIANLTVDVGFAYLQAAREVMKENKTLTADESDTIKGALTAGNLALGTGLAIASGAMNGQAAAKLLTDWKMVVKVTGAVVKASKADPDTQTIATVGLAFTSKFITVGQILAKSAK